MTDAENTGVDNAIPVSPNTGLDPEIRAFMSRLMTGYEASHRQIATLCETLADRGRHSEEMIARTIQLQQQMLEERERMVMQNHRRELEAAAAKDRQQALAEVKRDVRAVGLLAAKKFLGIPLTGNDSHGLQDFLSTLTPDQIDSAMSSGSITFSPAQQHQLVAIMTSLAKSEETDKAAE